MSHATGKPLARMVGTTAVAAGLWAAALLDGTPVVWGAAPVATVVWLLVALDTAYRMSRALAHVRRRRASSDHRALWAPSGEAAAPASFPGALVLTPELRRVLGDPVARQGALRARGVRLALAPFLAATALATQAVLLPRGGPAAVGLAAAAAVILLYLLTLVWTSPEPTGAWVTSRFRRELLRREEFLVLARTGPYLQAGPDDALRIAQARVARMVAADAHELARLAALSDGEADGGERPWIDEVWRHDVDESSAETVERMRAYLEYRIKAQILFLGLAVEKCRKTEARLSAAAKSVVVAGAVAATSYVIALAAADRSPGIALLSLAAAALPALCNGMLALQNLYGAQRLASSYRETQEELSRHAHTLTLLIGGSAPSGTRFRALALHVEAALTRELLQWRNLVSRPEFDPVL